MGPAVVKPAIRATRTVYEPCRLSCCRHRLPGGQVMRLPNFLIIGAARSGTTSLYRALNQHPQVFMSPLKEPGFFAYGGQLCDFYYHVGNSNVRVVIVTDLEEYAKLFQGATDELAIGEASTDYLYNPTGSAPERIQHYIPDAKLIAILRNPVQTVYSHFLYGIQLGLEPLDDFEQALQVEDERIRNNWGPFYHYQRKGFYGRQLKPYFDRFGREQIRVYLYDEWAGDSTRTLKDVFRFLGVDDAFAPDTAAKARESGLPRSGELHRILTTHNRIRSLARQLLPQAVRGRVRLALLNRNLTKPQLAAETRWHLIEQYRDDILELEVLIERDLSHWLRGA